MKSFYEKFVHYNVPFWIFSFVALGLIIASFCVPPLGLIDPTVLAAVGEVFAFAALWAVLRAIDKGGVAKIRHHEIELEIKNEKKPEEPVIKSR